MRLPGEPSIVGGYAELMSRYALPLFVTQTFRHRQHPENVVKAHRYQLGLINDELHGKNWRRKGIDGCQSVLGIERHKSWLPHSHAVVGHASVDLGAHTKQMHDMRVGLQNRFEAEWGFSKVLVAQSLAHVNNYIAKYVTKDGEIYLSDRLERFNEQSNLLTPCAR